MSRIPVLISKISIILLLCQISNVYPGIPGLSKFLQSNYKSCWIDLSTEKDYAADHVCVDMNQVLHTCYRSGNQPDRVSAKLFFQLDKIFSKLKPAKSIIFAFDGPAPFAKMQTQLNRRKSSAQSSLMTPGNDFMNSIEDIMLCYTLQRLHRPALRNVSFFISDATAPGEGELKLIKWIHNHMPLATDGEQPERLVICGSDSDIILQALAINSSVKCEVLQLHTQSLFRISDLAQQILESCYSTHDDDTSTSTIEEVINNTTLQQSLDYSVRIDLMMLMVLQGNDYLPRLRGIWLSDTLKCYGKVMQALPEGKRYLVDREHRSFNFQALWLLMRELHSLEGEFLALPVTVPSSSQSLFVMAQRMRALWSKESPAYQAFVERMGSSAVEWLEDQHEVKIDPDTGLSSAQWRSSVKVLGRWYRAVSKRRSKWAARQSLAEAVMKDLSPAYHRHFLRERQRAIKELNRLKIREGHQFTNASHAPELNTDTTEDKRSKIKSSEHPEPFRLEIVEPGDPSFWETDMNNLEEVLGIKGPSWEEEELDVSVEEMFSWHTPPSEEVEELRREQESQLVRKEQYLEYVADIDVETYLEGLLWVSSMYAEGECPAQGYSYVGFAPMSPLGVVDYLERKTREVSGADEGEAEILDQLGREEVRRALSERIRVPYTNERPLSASAACVCLIPLEAGPEFVPLRFHSIWRRIQTKLFGGGHAKGRGTSLKGVKYQQLTNTLTEAINEYNVTTEIIDKQNIPSNDKPYLNLSSHADSKRAKRRRAAYSKRVVSNSGKIWGPRFSPSNYTGAPEYSPTQMQVFAPQLQRNAWTIITPLAGSLKEAGYRGQYRSKKLRLPLPFVFSTPRFLPPGYQVLRAEEGLDNSVHSEDIIDDQVLSVEEEREDRELKDEEVETSTLEPYKNKGGSNVEKKRRRYKDGVQFERKVGKGGKGFSRKQKKP